jgi:hypothetical protein
MKYRDVHNEMLSLTGDLIIGQWILLVRLLERREPKKIKVPLVRKVQFQIADFSPYWNGACECLFNVNMMQQSRIGDAE